MLHHDPHKKPRTHLSVKGPVEPPENIGEFPPVSRTEALSLHLVRPQLEAALRGNPRITHPKRSRDCFESMSKSEIPGLGWDVLRKMIVRGEGLGCQALAQSFARLGRVNPSMATWIALDAWVESIARNNYPIMRFAGLVEGAFRAIWAGDERRAIQFLEAVHPPAGEAPLEWMTGPRADFHRSLVTLDGKIQRAVYGRVIDRMIKYPNGRFVEDCDVNEAVGLAGGLSQREASILAVRIFTGCRDNRQQLSVKEAAELVACVAQLRKELLQGKRLENFWRPIRTCVMNDPVSARSLLLKVRALQSAHGAPEAWARLIQNAGDSDSAHMVGVCARVASLCWNGPYDDPENYADLFPRTWSLCPLEAQVLEGAVGRRSRDKRELVADLAQYVHCKASPKPTFEVDPRLNGLRFACGLALSARGFPMRESMERLPTLIQELKGSIRDPVTVQRKFTEILELDACTGDEQRLPSHHVVFACLRLAVADAGRNYAEWEKKAIRDAFARQHQHGRQWAFLVEACGVASIAISPDQRQEAFHRLERIPKASGERSNIDVMMYVDTFQLRGPPLEKLEAMNRLAAQLQTSSITPPHDGPIPYLLERAVEVATRAVTFAAVRGDDEHKKTARAQYKWPFYGDQVPHPLTDSSNNYTPEAKQCWLEASDVCRRALGYAYSFDNRTYEARRSPGASTSLIEDFGRNCATVQRTVRADDNNAFPGTGFVTGGILLPKVFQADEAREDDPYHGLLNGAYDFVGAEARAGDFSEIELWDFRAFQVIFFAPGARYELFGSQQALIAYSDHFENPGMHGTYSVPASTLAPLLRAAEKATHLPQHQRWAPLLPAALISKIIAQGRSYQNLTSLSTQAGLNAAASYGSLHRDFVRRLPGHTHSAFGEPHVTHINGYWEDVWSAQLERAVGPQREAHKAIYEKATRMFRIERALRMMRAMYGKGITAQQLQAPSGGAHDLRLLRDLYAYRGGANPPLRPHLKLIPRMISGGFDRTVSDDFIDSETLTMRVDGEELRLPPKLDDTSIRLWRDLWMGKYRYDYDAGLCLVSKI